MDRFVRERANGRCEYCRFPGIFSELPFVIDHIIARQHGGRTRADNLALCCAFCNRHKGPNIAGIDPDSGMLTPLFHPRRDGWREHFRWKGIELVGSDHVGRATVIVLAINEPRQLAIRRALWNEKLLNLD